MSVAVRSLCTVVRKGNAVPNQLKTFSRCITTHTTSNASRQVTTNEVSNIANKSAYATVAPGTSHIPSFQPSEKFRVPFDEGPTMSTLDNIVEQVDCIAGDVAKERGYQIIGKVKAPKDELMKILAVGDMRIWQ